MDEQMNAGQDIAVLEELSRQISDDLEGLELRCFKKLDINGIYEREANVIVAQSPVFVQRYDQRFRRYGYLIYKTAPNLDGYDGWAIAPHTKDMIEELQGGAQKSIAFYHRPGPVRWQEYVETWQPSAGYVRRGFKNDHPFFTFESLIQASEEQATQKFVAAERAKGLEISGPRTLSDLDSNPDATITATLKGLGIWNRELRETAPRVLHCKSESGEDSAHRFRCFSGVPDLQLSHWGQGLYGLYERGSLVAREVGPTGSWTKQLLTGQDVPCCVDIHWDKAMATAEERQARLPAAPKAKAKEKTGNRSMNYSGDTEKALEDYNKFVREKKALGEIHPLLDSEKPSDLTVFREVIINRAYQNFNGSGGLAAFVVRPDDVLLDVGANVGMATWFYYTCGIRRGDLYEPARGCHDTLEENVARLRRAGCNFTLHKEAVGNASSQVEFLDKTDNAKGGSSRSCVASFTSQSSTSGTTYKVNQVPFGSALTTHSVVKMDCEGAELPILRSATAWKGCRLLVTEVSVAQIRKTAIGHAWKVLDELFNNLSNCGFKYCKAPKLIYEMGYWQKRPGDRKYCADSILWLARPAPNVPDPFEQVDMRRFLVWRFYKKIMEAGGLKKGETVEGAYEKYKPSSAEPSSKRQRT